MLQIVVAHFINNKYDTSENVWPFTHLLLSPALPVPNPPLPHTPHPVRFG